MSSSGNQEKLWEYGKRKQGSSRNGLPLISSLVHCLIGGMDKEFEKCVLWSKLRIFSPVLFLLLSFRFFLAFKNVSMSKVLVCVSEIITT